MSRFLKVSAIALLALVTFVPAASARGFYGGGRGFVGVGYGPGFYPGYYGYGPWYGPGYYYTPNVGQVEISTKQKGNQIFVDGGYAGLTGELKKFPLHSGTHTIELRNAKGQTFYQEKINVIGGKKLKAARPEKTDGSARGSWGRSGFQALIRSVIERERGGEQKTIGRFARRASCDGTGRTL